MITLYRVSDFSESLKFTFSSLVESVFMAVFESNSLSAETYGNYLH